MSVRKIQVQNKKIVTDLLKAMERGDDIIPFLHEDATWWLPEFAGMGGTYNLTDLFPVMDRVMSLVEGPFQFTINAVTAEEDRVAVDCEGRGKFKDGEAYFNTYHALFRVRDGKIISCKEFMNTAFVDRAFEKRGA